jgi:DNA-binding NarL/FixJ family response regulator
VIAPPFAPLREKKLMVLTEIEKAILRCLALGMQSKEIAAEVGRSKATVEANIRVLYLKLGARSRAHLVANAIRSGIRCL